MTTRKPVKKKPAPPRRKPGARKAFSGAVTPPTPMFPLLNEAAMNGDLDLVREMLDGSADIEQRDNNDKSTPLILAARYVHPDVALELIRRGADVNARTRDGDTALLWAAVNNLVDVGRKLIENGADFSVEANGNKSVWDIANLQSKQPFRDMLPEAMEARVRKQEEAARAKALQAELKDCAVLQRKIAVLKPFVLRR